jgi:hypothetical protein
MKQITLRKQPHCTGPYLGYSFDCEGNKCWSGFGLKSTAFAKKISTLIPFALRKSFLSGKTVSIQDNVFSDIQGMWFDSRYKKYKDVYVSTEANIENVAIAYEAFKNNTPLMIQYSPGWEMYPSDDENSCVSDDGLNHVAFIGKSTGIKPVLLHLEGSSSDGGSEFSFHGIQSIKSAGGALCA